MLHANCSFATEEEARSLADAAKPHLERTLRDQGVSGPIVFDGPREIDYADGSRGWGLIAHEAEEN